MLDDLNKLKVVELKAELAKRGIEVKGVKAVLVERLRLALEEERASEGGHESEPSEEPTPSASDDSSSIQEIPQNEPEPEAEFESVNEDQSAEVTATAPEESPEPAEDPLSATKQEIPSQDQEQYLEEQEETPPQPIIEAIPVQKPPPEHDFEEQSDQVETKPEVDQEIQEPVESQPHFAEDEIKQESNSEALPENVTPEKEAAPVDIKVEKMDQSDLTANENAASSFKSEPMDADVAEGPGSKDVKPVHVKSEDRKRRRSSSPDHKSRSPPRKVVEDEPTFDPSAVLLSWYDSDLNLKIEKDFLTATPLHEQGFGYVWAGARASYGFLKGKVAFEVKIIEKCDISHLLDEPDPHVVRVGWSAQGTSMQLGEEKFSYGFGGTGKASEDCKFKTYGTAFGAGDVVTAYLDMDSEPCTISYSVNGCEQGVAFEINRTELGERALFPHILSKNSKFSVTFVGEPAFPLREGYLLVGNTNIEDRVAGPKAPAAREDCEMIMMCGLPGAGKTYWCTHYSAENPDKMYNILGTNNLLDKMKVMGLPRKRNYSGRWEALIEKCTKCLNSLLDIASQRRRNYILDQTNVYPSAQKRKMKPFEGFKRRAVVVVPNDEEFQRRVSEREAAEGKDVPDSAVLDMKANFRLPEVGSSFSELTYVELTEEEARPLVEQYNQEAKDKGHFPQNQPLHNKRFKSERSGDRHSSRDSRDTHHRDSRDSHRDSRDHRDGRRDDHWDRGSSYRPRGGHMDRRNQWQPRGGGGGGGGHFRDRNDYRGGRNDMRGGWRGSQGRSGGGYDRNRSGFGQNRGFSNNHRGPPQQKNWGAGGNWNNWNQPQDYQWQGGYSHSQWKGYPQQQSYGQNYGQSYNYGNGNASNWNQQYYSQGSGYFTQQQQQQQHMPSAGTSAQQGGAGASLGTSSYEYSTQQPQTQWGYSSNYGYTTSTGSSANAAGITDTTHNAVTK